jgi:hypothetical protein
MRRPRRSFSGSARWPTAQDISTCLERSSPEPAHGSWGIPNFVHGPEVLSRCFGALESVRPCVHLEMPVPVLTLTP